MAPGQEVGLGLKSGSQRHREAGFGRRTGDAKDCFQVEPEVLYSAKANETTLVVYFHSDKGKACNPGTS